MHNGFPGVLLRVTLAVTEPTIRVLRHTAGDPASAWITVRSGVVHMEAGTGHAYDVEAEPGRAYTYRLAVGGYTGVDHDVSVIIPDYGPRDAWLKHLHRPELSRPVRILAPWEPTRGTWATVRAPYGGLPIVTDALAAQGRVGDMILETRTEKDWRAIDALIRTPGVMLLQASPRHGLDPLYLARTAIGHDRPVSSGYRLRNHVASYVEMDRPDEVDVPPVIPGWSWDDYTAGHTLATLGAAYSDQWGVLLAGVQTAWSAAR